jgi:hypothetical protein
MPTFMVVGTLRPDTDLADINALREAEHKQLEVLREERKIGVHYNSPARGTAFIEIIAEDEKEAAETMGTLPFARFFDADVYPTVPPDAAELAHRASLLT